MTSKHDIISAGYDSLNNNASGDPDVDRQTGIMLPEEFLPLAESIAPEVPEASKEAGKTALSGASSDATTETSLVDSSPKKVLDLRTRKTSSRRRGGSTRKRPVIIRGDSETEAGITPAGHQPVEYPDNHEEVLGKAAIEDLNKKLGRK